MQEKVIVTNRRARHDYEILESLEAGIELKGAEVKSLRAGGASLGDSFARAEGTELFIYNMHVAPYEFAGLAGPDPLRSRKLLLHRREIRRLIAEMSVRKLALIPLKVYFKDGIAKVELGLAKGKRLYDKRRSIRKREMDMELRKARKGR